MLLLFQFSFLFAGRILVGEKLETVFLLPGDDFVVHVYRETLVFMLNLFTPQCIDIFNPFTSRTVVMFNPVNPPRVSQMTHLSPGFPS